LADAGKKLPLVDKVVVHIIIESQPKWQNFHKAKIDLLEIKDANIAETIDDKRELRSEHKSKGIRLFLTPQLDITFFAFNHEDNLFKKNQKLRQAMSMAWDRAEANKMIYENTAYESQ